MMSDYSVHVQKLYTHKLESYNEHEAIPEHVKRGQVSTKAFAMGSPPPHRYWLNSCFREFCCQVQLPTDEFWARIRSGNEIFSDERERKNQVQKTVPNLI